MFATLGRTIRGSFRDPPYDALGRLRRLHEVLAGSDGLHVDIEALLGDFHWPDLDTRGVATLMLCQLTFEHGVAIRALLGAGLHTSAVALLRVQFDAVVRGAWLLHVANDEQAERLAAPLTPEGEQGAKNLPSTHDMIAALEQRGPRGSGTLLRRFKERVGRGLDSFVHAGVHPIHRRAGEYPEAMLADLVRNSNAVSMLATIVLAELCAPAAQFRQRFVAVQHRHQAVLPALESG